MTSHDSAARRPRRRAELTVAALAALVVLGVPLGVYVGAALATASADGGSAADVVCFDPERFGLMSPLRSVLAALMSLGALAFLFAVPGLLGTLVFARLRRTRRTAHAWSLAANTAALVVICSILRHTVGVERSWLAAAWLGWNAVLFALAWNRGRSLARVRRLGRRYLGGLAIGMAAAVISAAVFLPEQFVQCFTLDGAETYELARSLRGHFLPYWELETWRPEHGNRLGTVVVNPSLVNSYWTCGLQTLLGGKELPTRLPYWVWWMAIFATSYRMVRPRRSSGRLAAAVVLAAMVFLVSLLFTFYVGYDQYMADIANPGVTDALFILCILLALDCLRHGEGWGFALSMTLASLVLYSGPLMLLAILAGAWLWRPIERSRLGRWALGTCGMLAAALLCYLFWGWREGSLPAWLDTLDIEYVNDYLAGAPRWRSALVFLGYSALGCGVVPAWGLIRGFGRDPWQPWQRSAATAMLIYLVAVLLSGYKNLHYLAPLWPVAVVLFLQSPKVGGWGKAKRCPSAQSTEAPGRLAPTTRHAPDRAGMACPLAGAALVLCILACWPKQRSTFTLNRQLGMRTTVATDSYMTALRWARVRLPLIEQAKVSWYFEAQTWMAYADLDPELKEPGPFVLSDGGPPTPAYRPVVSRPAEGPDATAKLYALGEGWANWLRRQHRKPPLERYPAIMRPLADGPYSPHNNGLQDVQRLKWPW